MFDLTILGSAAAEGFPALFCGCDTCKKARTLGGKDLRMRTAYAFGNALRFDYGPDSLAQELRFGLDSSLLHHLFITHPHGDHLVINPLYMRCPGFSQKFIPLHIYGSRDSIAKIADSIWTSCDSFPPDHYKNISVTPHVLTPFEPITLTDEEAGTVVIPLLAKHYHVPEQAFLYAIKRKNLWTLLANDTGFFPDATWAWLEKQDFRFSLVICDCTFGTRDDRGGHLGGSSFLEIRDRLAALGRIDSTTTYVANHFTHNCGSLHAELEAFFSPHNVLVGYDGMKL